MSDDQTLSNDEKASNWIWFLARARKRVKRAPHRKCPACEGRNCPTTTTNLTQSHRSESKSHFNFHSPLNLCKGLCLCSCSCNCN
ncbi:hypothetical protein M5D96_007230 [Drosophila gunungcola]|uniref:Uncharacterized protein n=1 Tax=Drosophila gunungcola TaxID=103775 RepID=A0A9P9YMT2_9MUSC|nr:hypothetical protein M5D96_007230 [Drosophila gunungcola]